MQAENQMRTIDMICVALLFLILAVLNYSFAKTILNRLDVIDQAINQKSVSGEFGR